MTEKRTPRYFYVADLGDGWEICFDSSIKGQSTPCQNGIYGSFDTQQEAWQYIANHREELEQSADEMCDALDSFCEALLSAKH